MSFELTNASAIFQKLINHVLYNHLNKFIITYLDNILIFFKTEKKHEKHVKFFLENFKKKFLLPKKILTSVKLYETATNRLLLPV